MISIDRKVCSSILRLSQDYETFFRYRKGDSFLSANEASACLDVPASEVYESLKRLESNGLIRHTFWTLGGSVDFQIAPELLHRKAFFFDAITRRFLWGFIAGIGATLLPELIIYLIARGLI